MIKLLGNREGRSMLYIRTLKNHTIPTRSVFMAILMIVLIVLEILGGRSYADEIIGVCSGLYIIYLLFSSKLYFEDFIIAVMMMLTIVIGVLGNSNSKLINSKFAILIDIVAEFKILLTFFACKYFVNEETKDGIVKLLYRVAKIFIIIAFIFGIITIFVNTGMYSSERYGLPSYKFIFPMSFQFFVVELLALYIILEYKNIVKDVKIKKYVIMCIITMLLITKGPPIIFSFVFLILMYYFKKNKKIKLRILIPIAVIGCVLGSYQIETYLMNENAPRYLFFEYSFVTANDYFPLGSGFATFGSDMASRNYSKLYYKYGFHKLFGMNPDDSSFMSDTFWPMAIGQFGWIFGILYIGVYLYIFKFISSDKYSSNIKAFLYAILLQFYIHAIGSAILSSSAGLIGFIIIGIIIMPRKRIERNKIG